MRKRSGEEMKEKEQNEDEELKRILEMKKSEERIKSALRLALTSEAYERMMVVKVANHELYSLAAQQLLALHQRIGRKISEEEVKKILRLLKSGTEKETKIEIRRK